MLELNRRTFLSLLAGAAASQSLYPAARAWGQEEDISAKPRDGWQSRVIALRPERETDKPPVVSAVCLQPEGNQLATAGDDHLAWIWDFNSGESLHRLEGHADWVRTLDYSPDGKVLATAGNDRRIVYWNADTGEKLRVFATHKEVITKIVFSPDGASLATVGFDNNLRIYDAKTGERKHELACTCPDMRTVAYSPDESKLAAGGRDGKILIWNTADGKLEQEQAIHQKRVRSVVFSPDGRRLASSGEDRFIRVRQLDSEDPGITLPDRSAKVHAITFLTPDILATGGSDNLVRLWDLTRKAEITQLRGHLGSVAGLATRDGTLISGSFDTTIRVWTSEQSVTKIGRRLAPPIQINE